MKTDRNFIIYAQALDNSGDVEIYAHSPSESCYENLIHEPRDEALLHLIDRLLASNSFWEIGQSPLKVYVDLSGNCIVEARSVERDTAGRISPVFFIFNALKTQRKDFLSITKKIPSVMGRNFDDKTKQSFESLQKLMNYPAIVIFFRILFTR